MKTKQLNTEYKDQPPPSPVRVIPVTDPKTEKAEPYTIAAGLLRRWKKPAACTKPGDKYLYYCYLQKNLRRLTDKEANRVIEIMRGKRV